jgi:hypothetical protein
MMPGSFSLPWEAEVIDCGGRLHACNHDFVAGLELITSNPIFTAPAS